MLGEDLLPIRCPVLLRAEIDASADQRVGIQVHRLTVHDAGDEFVRGQAAHRRQALRVIGDPYLKSRRGEEVFLLSDQLLLAGAAGDGQQAGQGAKGDQLCHGDIPGGKAADLSRSKPRRATKAAATE